MSKNKRRKSEKKRNLKYGNIASAKEKNQIISREKIEVVGSDRKSNKSKGNNAFKKELRKNLAFVGAFLVFLLALYFVLTYTNLLDSILNSFGLIGIYKK